MYVYEHTCDSNTLHVFICIHAHTWSMYLCFLCAYVYNWAKEYTVNW